MTKRRDYHQKITKRKHEFYNNDKRSKHDINPRSHKSKDKHTWQHRSLCQKNNPPFKSQKMYDTVRKSTCTFDKGLLSKFLNLYYKSNRLRWHRKILRKNGQRICTVQRKDKWPKKAHMKRCLALFMTKNMWITKRENEIPFVTQTCVHFKRAGKCNPEG